MFKSFAKLIFSLIKIFRKRQEIITSQEMENKEKKEKKENTKKKHFAFIDKNQ